MTDADRPALSINSDSIEQTLAIGRAVGRCCAIGDIIGLDGELGAGKTQFVRGLAQGLGLDSRQVSSPTFVMVQEYDPSPELAAAARGGKDVSRVPVLVHIDAYRLRNADDLSSIGWHDDGQELREGAVVAIEWAKLIDPMLGPDLLSVHIEHAANGRRFSFSARGAWLDKMQRLTDALFEAC